MASTSAASMALPLAGATQNRMPSSEAFFKPLPVKPWRATGGVKRPNGKLQVKAGASSFKEKAVTGLTAAALTTSMMIPEVAQAADGVTPSLKNFLLSIAAGGVTCRVKRASKKERINGIHFSCFNGSALSWSYPKQGAKL
ncbi:hypothetical protein F383_26780 [Gossypium arboreum]|uniref:Uncharacterized protein n=1 Tax=Gossypium arboreum TaxID=29729 RepID=A0A0B0MMN7_GOSAR|nr:hypothetical protein F383_26780 [Gossypium arboreum]